MAKPKHRAAKHRAERPKGAIRKHGVLIAAPVAATVTISVVGLAVQTTPPEVGQAVVSQASLDRISDRAVTPTRSGSRNDVSARVEQAQVSRQEQAAQRERVERRDARATTRAVASADDRMWTTAELNLWTEAAEAEAEQVGVLDAEERVLVTGRADAGREEIVLGGESRWVTEGYLSAEKPAETGLDVQCTNGSSIATPVSENISAVYQVVCGNFPDVTSYGTLRSDGEHAQGIAIDIMVSGSRGYEVRDFLQANYQELGINYIIYSQQIWSVDRASEGWRAMEDRGSVTQNHYDHVHVTTY